jgi:hypothetical protein
VKPYSLPKDDVNLIQTAAAAWLVKNIIKDFICCNKRHSCKVQKFFLAGGRLFFPLFLCTMPAQNETSATEQNEWQR